MLSEENLLAAAIILELDDEGTRKKRRFFSKTKEMVGKRNWRCNIVKIVFSILFKLIKFGLLKKSFILLLITVK